MDFMRNTPLQKFAEASGDRLLTRAAQIGAATVRERLLVLSTPVPGGLVG
jgi:hypothetical protein